MKHFSLSIILDCIMAAFSLFLLFCLIFNVFMPKVACYILSLTLALSLSVLLYKFLLDKRIRQNQKNALSEKCQSLSLQFCVLRHSETLDCFFKAYTKQNLAPKKYKGVIILQDSNIIVAPLYSFEGLTKTDVVRIYNLSDSKKSVRIYTNLASEEVIEFSKKFSNVQILLADKAYELLEQTDSLPEFSFSPFPKKNGKRLLKNLFVKKRAKNFLAFGIFFLLSSYFVPFKLYYIISGAIMLIIALLCLTIGKKQTDVQ